MITQTSAARDWNVMSMVPCSERSRDKGDQPPRPPRSVRIEIPDDNRREFVRKIAAYARDCRAGAVKWNPRYTDPEPYREQLRADWFEAMRYFVVFHAPYQGKRDEMGDRLRDAVDGVLCPFFSDRDGRDAKLARCKGNDLDPIRAELEACIGRGKRAGKARDIEMVLSALHYISKLPDKNIVNRSLEVIERGRLEAHWKELQKRYSEDGIVSVGPKIASFYLRSLVDLYEVYDNVPDESAFCLQPIDVHVRKVAAIMLGEADRDSADDEIRKRISDDEIRRRILDNCRTAGIRAIEFNMGAYYVDKNRRLPEVLDELRGAQS